MWANDIDHPAYGVRLDRIRGTLDEPSPTVLEGARPR